MLFHYLLDFDTVHRSTVVDHKHQVLRDAGQIRRSKEVHKVAVYNLRVGITGQTRPG